MKNPYFKFTEHAKERFKQRNKILNLGHDRKAICKRLRFHRTDDTADYYRARGWEFVVEKDGYWVITVLRTDPKEGFKAKAICNRLDCEKARKKHLAKRKRK
jgi:hypothetical protein